MTTAHLWEPTADGRWTPTDHARGPWDARHCHGGPVSAFLARACEHVDADGVDWQVARLTIELTRPTEVGTPLTVTAEVERPGRKVSLVAARLSDGARDVAIARAVRIARVDDRLPDHDAPGTTMSEPPERSTPAVSTWDLSGDGVVFHRDSVEVRVARGGWEDLGPAQAWFRLTADVVADERPSPLQRVAAAADFGNGISAALTTPEWRFINPDLTIHLARPATGEWIGLDAHTVYGLDGTTTGTGYAESVLHDEHGRLGRSVQSLIVARG